MDSVDLIRQHLTKLEELLKRETKAREEAEKRIADLEVQLASAKSVMNVLNQENNDSEQLYQVGWDVRRRFLELAREQVLFDERKDLSALVIENGNKAAHAGNGIVDALLVRHIPKEVFQWWGWDRQSKPNPEFHSINGVFESLYHSTPANYLEHTAKDSLLREAIDLQATIRTVKTMNRGVDRPLKEKQSALDAFEFIMNKYKRAEQDGRELTEDEEREVTRRLEVLREFTKVIVEYDRRMKSKEVGKGESKTTY